MIRDQTGTGSKQQLARTKLKVYALPTYHSLQNMAAAVSRSTSFVRLQLKNRGSAVWGAPAPSGLDRVLPAQSYQDGTEVASYSAENSVFSAHEDTETRRTTNKTQ